MLFSRSHSFAGVESRPDACTLLTTTLACAPLGITTLPFTVTFCATLATTPCPALASLELMDWSMVTVIFDPVGSDVAETTAGSIKHNVINTAEKRARGFISVTSLLIGSHFI